MVPIHQQISDYIVETINNQCLQANDKLPSERELVERFRSTRITVRDAFTRLESEGRIYRANRRGWFVAPPRFIMNPGRKVNFNAMAIEQQRQPQTQVISLNRIKANATIAKALGIKNRAAIIHLQRVRSLDGRPVMAEDIYLDASRYPDFEQQDVSASITDILKQQYNVECAYENSDIQIGALSQSIATLLETNSSAPCLNILRQRHNKQGHTIDYNMEYWVHNAVAMQIESHM